MFSLGDRGGLQAARGSVHKFLFKGLYTCLLTKNVLKLVIHVHAPLYECTFMCWQNFQRASYIRSWNNKNRLESTQNPNEERIQNEKTILQKKKNHYSRIHFAINGAGFSKLQMSAEAHPSSPLLNQLQWGQLAVPAGPDVPKCTCSPRHFWLCSSWGVSPQRSEVREISAY